MAEVHKYGTESVRIIRGPPAMFPPIQYYVQEPEYRHMSFDPKDMRSNIHAIPLPPPLKESPTAYKIPTLDMATQVNPALETKETQVVSPIMNTTATQVTIAAQVTIATQVDNPLMITMATQVSPQATVSQATQVGCDFTSTVMPCVETVTSCTQYDEFEHQRAMQANQAIPLPPPPAMDSVPVYSQEDASSMGYMYELVSHAKQAVHVLPI